MNVRLDRWGRPLAAQTSTADALDDELCGLCGQPAKGYAAADGKRLCHDTAMSCYHRWTVYKERPKQ